MGEGAGIEESVRRSTVEGSARGMNSRSKSHQGIDLDEIERHIREASATPPIQAGPVEDPLAELARIVGGGPVPRREPRIEPARIPQPSVPPQQPTRAAPARANFQPAAAPPLSPSPRQPPQASPSLEDDIERLLQKAPAKPAPAAPLQREEELETAMRSLDTLLKGRPAPKPPAPQFDDWTLRTEATVAPSAQPEAPTFNFEHEMARAATPETRPVEPEQPVVWREDPPRADLDFEPDPAPPPAARSKRPFIMVAAVLGVAAAGVGGALSMRGPSDRPGNGQPPVIVADRGPVKVQPTNPGGLEVPDQNKLVLDRAPSGPRPTPKVVNNEEQPMDLREAVRREAALAGAPPKATPAPLASTAAPAAVPVVVAPPPQATLPAPTVVSTPNRAEANRAEPSSLQAIRPDAIPSPPASPAAIQPSSSQANSSHATTSSAALDGAQEPRRVRTVAIKPPEPGSAVVEATSPMPARTPTPPPPPQQSAAVTAAPPPVAATPPAIAQTPAEPPPAVVPAAPPKPKVQGSIEASREAARTARQTQARSQPRAPDAEDATGATAPAPLQITPPLRGVRSRAAQRVAAVEPSPSSPPQPAPTAPFLPSEAAPSPAGGSFVVQLTSEGSDASARAAISRLQSRFGELGPYSSSIQRREVRGQMRYRVRFGSMSRETAGALCASLKSKGQDCILQPN